MRADRAPSLVGVAARLSADQMREILERGRGFMPSFAGVSDVEKRAVIAYLGYRDTSEGAVRIRRLRALA